MNVNMFTLNNEILETLEAVLSQERMTTYTTATGGDKEKALRLYTWNIAVSAAFYGPLQSLEVSLRNSMHQQLSLVYGPDWYDNNACGLDAQSVKRVREAKDKLNKGRYPIDPPHMVAELPFGFWVALLGKGGHYTFGNKKNYDMTLWRPALHKAFPHSRLSRRDTHRPLDYLRTLRNRIAHHEPIFSRHLQKDFQSILDVTGWICPATSRWIKNHSRVEILLPHAHSADTILF